MLTIKVRISAANERAIGDELTAIAELLDRGYASGSGWELEGEREDSPDDTNEHAERQADILNGPFRNS